MQETGEIIIDKEFCKKHNIPDKYIGMSFANEESFKYWYGNIVTSEEKQNNQRIEKEIQRIRDLHRSMDLLLEALDRLRRAEPTEHEKIKAVQYSMQILGVTLKKEE